MSKKRSKSNVGSAGVQRWEQALLTSAFCEQDKWNASISLVVGEKISDYDNITTLASAVNAGTRRLFSVVTFDELIEQVHDLGNPRAKKGKDLPANYEVCEPCKQYLDTGDAIPVPLLAKLLKWKLLDVKHKDLKRRETEKKGLSDKDGKSKKDKKERSKSPAKGKAGKKTPELPNPKGESKLRKRGEEDTDSKYIDDEPDDGPSHYVLVCGFHDPNLPSCLAEVGIHIDCIIKVQSQEEEQAEGAPGEGETKDEPQQDAVDEEVKLLQEQRKKELCQFWRDILPLLRMAPPGSSLHDVARLEYLVKPFLMPESADEQADAKAEFGAALFEDVACMMYDQLDSKRQWKNFLENLQLIHVPVHGTASLPQTTAGEAAPVPVPSMTPATKTGAESMSQLDGKSEAPPSDVLDMRYYNELMNTVPHESVSVPLVMHCMLEQICASEEDREPPSETPKPTRSDGLDDELAKHVSHLAFKLALTEQEMQAMSQEFDPPKAQEQISKQPLLINYHDNVTRRLNHLKPYAGLNPLQAELEMMGYQPTADLHKYPRPVGKIGKERLARLQELLHFCATGSLNPAEIDRAFKQFVFECMDLTTSSETGELVQSGMVSQRDIPWDDPYPYFKGMIPKEELPQYERQESLPPLDVISAVPSDADRVAEQVRSGAKSPSPAPEPPQSPQPRASSPGKDPEGTRPVSPGILKTSRPGSSSSTSRKSLSGHSVHFETTEDGAPLQEPGDADPEDQEIAAIDTSVDADAMDVINEVQKRNLDRWCFAEHLEPQVLQQVLKKAEFTHPCLDTYYHKRDNTLLVVLHNPYNKELQNVTSWHTELHSDVSFRNYLEHVEQDEKLQDWLRDEEAKYQASLLAKEVEKIKEEADAEASSRPASGKDKKKGRSKSPRKSPSRSGKSPSRSSSTERPSSSNPFVRQGSLKAWKEEQDRIREEEEEKERQKKEKSTD